MTTKNTEYTLQDLIADEQVRSIMENYIIILLN